jgi:glycosyltransferase involved in cell wall biosynthesis
MASGLPVIVSDGCGAGRALIRNNVNGWLFPRNDTKQLSDILALVSVKNDTELRDIGTRARQSIDQYSLDAFADGVLKIATLPLAKHGGFISKFLTHFWIGRISFYP